uniref:PB1-like domain-containing protein n=1 Tax=Oryza meridionalis TaxID=40149 RepID=A0A0E0C313_9ORYZ
MAEDTWTLILQLGGPTPEHESVQKEMDKDFICFFNIVGLVEDYDYSAMDYMYYKRREGSGTATLVGIENDDDVRRMLVEHESENKVRLCVMKEKACKDNRVSITPVKSSGEITRSESTGPKEDMDTQERTGYT